MELTELKGLLCPELHFVIHEIVDEEVKWGNLITPEHASFRVQHDTASLKENKVHIPIFSDHEMLGLQYAEAKKDGSFIYHDTYCNYVTYSVEYQRVNLVKFVHQFGVQVPKKSEEKFPQSIILHTVEYHFMYDYELKRWKFVETGSLDLFNERRAYIEELRNDATIKQIVQTYFKHRKRMKTSATTMVLEHNVSYRTLLQKWHALIESASQFHQIKRLFGEINEKNELLINQKLLDLYKSHLSCFKKATGWGLLDHVRSPDSSVSSDEQQLIKDLSSLIYHIKNTLYTPGYWVYDENVYPNACEIYNLLQLADTNRNEQTKKALKAKLIRSAKKENEHYYTLEQLSTKE